MRFTTSPASRKPGARSCIILAHGTFWPSRSVSHTASIGGVRPTSCRYTCPRPSSPELLVCPACTLRTCSPCATLSFRPQRLNSVCRFAPRGGPASRLQRRWRRRSPTALGWEPQGAAGSAPARTFGHFPQSQLARIERFIEEHLDEPISLAALAELVDLSMWHFMRRFNASHGLSPHEVITQRRLARAQRLLSDSKLTITEVALEIGMSHSHFSRSFLRRYGLSPREYRPQRPN